MINHRKVFSIDTGLVRVISFAFSQNQGWLLENLVFLELKRRGLEIYYHRGTKECDFLLKIGTRITQAIQVTASLTRENKQRELDGLLEAMTVHGLQDGLVLTDYQ